MRKVADDYREMNQRLVDKNNQLSYAVREMRKKIELIRKWISESELLVDKT